MKKWVTDRECVTTELFVVTPNAEGGKSRALETMGISEKPEGASAIMWEDDDPS